ncbi:hypothetical protein MYU51_018919 [Penicillium brevicompactum]|uniref:uncharacterized protein n=1 Tax=Penicillium brevicompactum TaxID=5074 RepID=UPI0025408BC1|nr:uncharacterized protein N7506_006375 [Penicillium brevicompactum]KAJ5332592.1 hypothetical protein N7506_006375 [Penicillium brevicompactum]
MGSSPSTISQDVNTMSSDSSSQAKQHHPMNLAEAVETYNVLRHLLPAELVLDILALAEYWLETAVMRGDVLTYDDVNYAKRQPYLTSEPIPEGRLEEIRIDIWSHDQGWSSYRESYGTYENSWTWFELAIEKFEGRTVIGKTDSIRLATNVHAQKEAQHHQIVFSRQNNVTLMQALETGDRVSIIPLARFPGWRNTVERASIQICTAPIL